MDNPQGNTATQIAAVKQLQQMHGRTILKAQEARQLTEPFGFVCETEFFTRNDNEEASSTASTFMTKIRCLPKANWLPM